MKKIEVNDDVYDALRKLTTDFHQSPNDVLAALLNVGVTPTASD
jgi:negative regulator of replication initiation